jgi:hypothetical protein
MTRHTLGAAALAATLGIALSSTPAITNVNPAAPAPSTRPQIVNVAGRDFMPGLTLAVKDPGGSTNVLQGDAVRAQTPTSFQVTLTLLEPGTYSLVVTNTDGGISPPFALAVKPHRPPADAPVIEKIAPSEPTKRQDAQLLVIHGQRFAAGLRAIVTDPMGADVPEATAAKVTPNSFELSVKLEHAGEYTLVVSNPSGATSNVFRILVR